MASSSTPSSTATATSTRSRRSTRSSTPSRRRCRRPAGIPSSAPAPRSAPPAGRRAHRAGRALPWPPRGLLHLARGPPPRTHMTVPAARPSTSEVGRRAYPTTVRGRSRATRAAAQPCAPAVPRDADSTHPPTHARGLVHQATRSSRPAPACCAARLAGHRVGGPRVASLFTSATAAAHPAPASRAGATRGARSRRRRRACACPAARGARAAHPPRRASLPSTRTRASTRPRRRWHQCLLPHHHTHTHTHTHTTTQAAAVILRCE